MGLSRFIIFEVWEVLPLSLHRLHRQITSLDYIRKVAGIQSKTFPRDLEDFKASFRMKFFIYVPKDIALVDFPFQNAGRKLGDIKSYYEK